MSGSGRGRAVRAASGRCSPNDLIASRFGRVVVVVALQGLDRPTVAAPAARDLVYRLLQHVLVLDHELAADREMVEGPRRLGARHVEAGQVAARPAPVPGGHASTVSPGPPRPS